MAHPCVFYFSYTRAYTQPVWLCSSLGSVRLHSLRSPLLGTAYYMRVFVRVSLSKTFDYFLVVLALFLSHFAFLHADKFPSHAVFSNYTHVYVFTSPAP